VLDVHPHAPLVHVGPGLHVAVQLVHEVPLVPHASSASPAAHVPLLQQPPLHCVFVPRHSVSHWCVIGLHACPAVAPLAAAQSVCELHPHVSVEGSHTAPFTAAEQTAQIPEPPHAPGVVPLTQVAPEQQNPAAHAPSPATPHAAVHEPETQVGVPAVQTAHACPFDPHVPLPVPASHVPELQHPPLHAVWLGPSHELVHVCALVSHALPGGQSEAASHPHVSVDGSHFEPPGLPGQIAQVPEPPHAPSCVPPTHAPDEQQNPPVHVPLLPAPQAAAHAPDTHVGVPAAHVAHMAPPVPQAPFWVPATQVPDVLQHPELHGCVASHALEQTCEALQASSAGQSATPAQPQVAPFSHACPLAATRQSVHVPPVLPHAPPAVPATQVPDAEQQPSLQPVVALPHVAEHVWLVVLHAWPTGQSPGAPQPQAPVARHACPAALPAQLAHIAPLPPHWVALVPDWHVPEAALEQHPVGHGWLALQTKTQIPAAHPCAPGPQSPRDAQPH